MARDTFIFYRDWLNALNDMPDNVQLEAYKAIAQYALDGNTPELSPMTKIAFSFIKPQIDRDLEKYNKVVERNRANGKLGGRKPKETEKTQENPLVFLETQSNPKNLEDEDDNEDVDDNDKEDTTNVVSKSRTDKSVALKKRESKQIIDYQYVLPEFKETFLEWLEYKKQRRESYKTEKSTKLCYDKLVKMSGNDPYTARQIVEQSMANNWSGLFELKTENRYEQRVNDNRRDSERRKFNSAIAVSTRVQEAAARRLAELKAEGVID